MTRKQNFEKYCRLYGVTGKEKIEKRKQVTERYREIREEEPTTPENDYQFACMLVFEENF